MKKLFIFILVITICLSSSSCSKQQESKKPQKKEESQEVETEYLKILAIGNSFSVDCMEYLYDIFQETKIKSVILGNAVYAGCSLQQHYNFASNDENVYSYKKNTTGYWIETDNYSLLKILQDENWDIITFQQTSKTCGLIDSYEPYLSNLINIVKELCPSAQLVWNATWAYQQDSTHSSFPNYDNDQIKMYNMIINCVENCIESSNEFAYVIPVCTAIQNARTSFIGDTLTRDGYHLDKLLGRYIAALTWYCKISGQKAESLKDFTLRGLISTKQAEVAIEAVDNALINPKQITTSKITTN